MKSWIVAAALVWAMPALGKTAVGNSQDKAWAEVDRLAGEQKLEESAKQVEAIIKTASAEGDDANWAKALIRTVQLRSALHGYETSVRFLRDQPWPKGELAQVSLELFYAYSLTGYLDAYSWEIRQREKVDTKGVVDLKAWTADQIYTEALKAYDRVYAHRESLGKLKVSALAEYLEPNTYPAGIRDTLRDAVTYLGAQLLSNSAYWRPEESNELFRLPLDSLVAPAKAAGKDFSLANVELHPLLRITTLLGDLEAWHASAGQDEAALEARIERVRTLHGAISDKDKRRLLIDHLKSQLPRFRQKPWWAMGQAVLGDLLLAADRPVAARAAADEGAKAFPGSPGAQACGSVVSRVLAKDYRLSMMTTDAAGRRSLELFHKNLNKIWFRAYAVDLAKFIEHSRDYNLLPAYEDFGKLLKQNPAAEWSADLPATKDYRQHRTFVTPPMEKSGLYVVMASANADFSPTGNRIVAGNFVISRIVLLSRNDNDGALNVDAVNGEDGAPVEGARISLYKFDYGKGHKADQTAVTDAKGHVRFVASSQASYFLIGQKGDQVAIDPQYQYIGREPPEAGVRGSFVYTDRGIYRPGQTLHFMAVAYKGHSSKGDFAVVPNQDVTVTLQDANGEIVQTKALKTNDFGSASGEFTVPTGKLLGNWSMHSSYGQGYAMLKVEEYKRPTFEVAFKEPEDALRLNRKAKLKGEAKYYFGLPVTNGSVRWHVTREAVYPWWWSYYFRGWGDEGGGAEGRTQTVATGSTKLDEKGEFVVEFLPEVEEKADSKDVTYNYSLSADLTDEGGETRSAHRSFRLGFVSVEASLSTGAAFLVAGKNGKLTVSRASLDGTPRAGKGTYKILTLKQPAEAVPPADLPLPAHAAAKGPDVEPRDETPGDKLRPRTASDYTAAAELARWEDGEERSHGALTHDAKGEATAELPALSPGAYRIRYETTDDFGAKYATFKDLLVAAPKLALALPVVFEAEQSTVKVGGTARFALASGLKAQSLIFDLYKHGKLAERRILRTDQNLPSLVEIPITEADRGGFGATLTLVTDHQFLHFQQTVYVPWDNKELQVEFSTFRDKLAPGSGETWKLHVSGHGAPEASAQVLAAMYDKSLDTFAPLSIASPTSLFPSFASVGWVRPNLGTGGGQAFAGQDFNDYETGPGFGVDRLKFYDNYGIGGMGMRAYSFGAGSGGLAAAPAPATRAARAKSAAPEGALVADAATEKAVDENKKADHATADLKREEPGQAAGGKAGEPAPEPRSNFAETAFFLPALRADKNGDVTLEFKVPDSVTAWKVWAVAFTKDLKSGEATKEARTVKDLMVRPYMPRFFREGDTAELKVVVNNAGTTALSGELTLAIVDAETGKSRLADFGVKTAVQSFKVKAGGGDNVAFPLVVPHGVGLVAFKVTAKAGALSDGELRPLPVLPSRLHLVQTKFVTLRDQDRRTMTFDDLAKNDDPTRTNEKMVVGIDAQLFYGVLKSLPYLVRYPYECTEQTLNRFLSTGIVSSVFKRYPAVQKMAQEMSKRETRLEPFNQADPNRRMAFEESPWLMESRGDPDVGPVIDVLDSRVAKAQRDEALAKLKKAQTGSGGFPWFPGGPPSPWMTLYIAHGFAKAAEFGVDVPKDMVVHAWSYLARHFREEYSSRMIKDDCCWEYLTFLNYTASAYPDASWTGNALTPEERERILAHSFKHWKDHSPYLKAYLALTLKRANRADDAKLVFDSVMDSAKTEQDQGTFWAAEDRSWLWYNDTIETHAFALRTLMELDPTNAKKDGLVLWLFLNKKLNHWKSTRATAEVIYSLVHYLEKENALGVKESATVKIGAETKTFDFAPDVYAGKAEVVVPGEKVDAKMATVTVEKATKGVMFASATWHFATDKAPSEARGDFFGVTRRYFRRSTAGKEATLTPMQAGDTVEAGDEVEVQLSLTSKHEAEYVHLRDPRGAGFEPVSGTSKWKYDLGLSWYEEIRDSGTNFFFEHLPVGEYTFKYRVRASMAGTFRVGPAEVESMYAPEFAAYSAGDVLTVK